MSSSYITYIAVFASLSVLVLLCRLCIYLQRQQQISQTHIVQLSPEQAKMHIQTLRMLQQGQLQPQQQQPGPPQELSEEEEAARYSAAVQAIARAQREDDPLPPPGSQRTMHVSNPAARSASQRSNVAAVGVAEYETSTFAPTRIRAQSSTRQQQHQQQPPPPDEP